MDPIRALFLTHRPGTAGDGAPEAAHFKADATQAGVEGGRESLQEQLAQAMHSYAAWTLRFHSSIAGCLNLNPTDQRCLDMILRSSDMSGDCMTPGQLARETKLTTGAVTGVLDRLEHAGYVAREHDADDRRRIIVRPVPERIKAEVRPLFGWVIREFESLCAGYSDEDLRKMIEFSREAQVLLQRATEELGELE